MIRVVLMSTSSDISLPREKCMKCRGESDLLMSSSTFFGGVFGRCNHKFCQICFRKENTASNLTHSCVCPCCHTLFFEHIQSIDEAILIGEAATMRINLTNQMLPDLEIADEDLNHIIVLYEALIDKLESALLLNPTNYFTLYSLFSCCSNGNMFLKSHKGADYISAVNGLKLLNYSFLLLDHPTLSESGYEVAKCMCYLELACVFKSYLNHPAALKYSKLAYEHCLRSPNHAPLSTFKDTYLKFRAEFAELPPLRFAVGDEVEFLQELDSGSKWKLGKIVELHYMERDFDASFTAPYRMQLLKNSADLSPVYAWVKADIDRYVRKVGVRSIEDTRYQARLDAKVEELARVYCSDEFMQDIYRTLALDREFVDMLPSVWGIELSERVVRIYRTYVMCRQPFIRTDSGYHVPSSEDVVAEIRAFFDPTLLSSNAAPIATSEDCDSLEVRVGIFRLIHDDASLLHLTDDSGIQLHLLESIENYNLMLRYSDPRPTGPGRHAGSYFTVPLKVSEAISKASTKYAIRHLQPVAENDSKLLHYLHAWIHIHICLENPNAGSACECPFTYFFVKFCLHHGTGVPKLALALYDRMNMQLSRDFIRCANPSCELNKLDQSTGQVKFKQCSRCKAVIYCSRECQTAHYPEHKKLCREHSAGCEGS